MGMANNKPPIRHIIAGAAFLIASLVILYHTWTDTPFPQIFSSSPPSRTPKTYLPFTFGYASLLQTLTSYQLAGWRDIIILDNSWDHYAFQSRQRLFKEFSSVVDVIRTPVHLRFAQLQGMMDHLAIVDGASVYLWGHTDTILLQNGTTPWDNLGRCLSWADSQGNATSQGVGVMFFQYDLLSAVYTSAAKVAPWDPAMPQYGADCDRYARIRLADFTAEDCPYRIGEIVHMHTILSEEEKETLWESGLDIGDQVEMLGKINNASDQYAWREGVESGGGKHDVLGMADKEAARAEGDGGRVYYEAKWGPFDCELAGRTPEFDIPAPR